MARSKVSMACNTCRKMLYGQKGRLGRMTILQVDYRHHQSEKRLRDAAERSGCYICRVVLERIQSHQDSAIRSAKQQKDGPYLTATIKPLRDRRFVFRLDFKLHRSLTVGNSKPVASFVLLGNESGNSSPSGSPAVRLDARPISSNTSDPKVTALAKSWIDECRQCHPVCQVSDKVFHPTRLIEITSATGSYDTKGAVRVVSSHPNEQQTNQPPFEGPYVTLSHRWGGLRFLKLTRASLPDFQTALLLDHLPLTFQHAIRFARELGVRWIWIDALCIVQDDEIDWLKESSRMHEVYANSYCNISATAAGDSGRGLFNARDPSRDWAQTVTINVDDLTGEQELTCTVLDLFFWEKYVEQAPVNKRSWVLQERLLAPRVLHWCQDQIAFECRHTSRAECRPEGLPHFVMIRGELVDGARLKHIDEDAGKELQKIRLSQESSSSNPDKLSKMVNEVKPRWHYYEIWKSVVETYTRMELTNSKDRMIALSGIARMIHGRMSENNIKDEYIAGLWQHGLAGQLLWHVNEAEGIAPQPFEDNRAKDDAGEHIYRAPTWSWGSVESSRGITFGEVSEKGLKISVEIVRLLYKTNSDNFGILTDGYLVIRGVLRRVLLTDKTAPALLQQAPRALPLLHMADRRNTRLSIDPPSWVVILLLQFLLALCLVFPFTTTLEASTRNVAPLLTFWLLASFGLLRPGFVEKPQDRAHMNRWAWTLFKDGRPDPTGTEYSVVYLDSPSSEPSIFGPDAQVFIIPAMQTSKQLICLLVQATDGDYGVRYRRIGLTKIPLVHKPQVRDILTPPGNNAEDRGRYYWGLEGQKTGENTICII